MMTIDDTLERVRHELDRIIEDKLETLEAEMRRNEIQTGPEDEEALDRPPVPGSPWTRSTVEEVLMRHREVYVAWRTETLATLRAQLQSWTENEETPDGHT